MRRVVVLLDEEPVLLAVSRLLAVHAHQGPAALELLAVESELELAFLVVLDGIALALGDPGAAVPQEHGAAAVLSRGDDALEITVVEGMVLHVDGQASLARVQAGSL